MNLYKTYNKPLPESIMKTFSMHCGTAPLRVKDIQFDMQFQYFSRPFQILDLIIFCVLHIAQQRIHIIDV